MSVTSALPASDAVSLEKVSIRFGLHEGLRIGNNRPFEQPLPSGCSTRVHLTLTLPELDTLMLALGEFPHAEYGDPASSAEVNALYDHIEPVWYRACWWFWFRQYVAQGFRRVLRALGRHA